MAIVAGVVEVAVARVEHPALRGLGLDGVALFGIEVRPDYAQQDVQFPVVCEAALLEGEGGVMPPSPHLVNAAHCALPAGAPPRGDGALLAQLDLLVVRRPP